MFDRTTKALLAVIAIGIWGLLLRPLFTPVPLHAASSEPQIASSNGILYVVRGNQVNASKVGMVGEDTTKTVTHIGTETIP